MVFSSDPHAFISKNDSEIKKIIYVLCLKNHMNIHNIEDFFQDFYVRFVTQDALKKYDSTQVKISTYVYTIIKNMIRQQKKSNEHKVRSHEITSFFQDSPTSTSVSSIDAFQFTVKCAPDYETTLSINNTTDQIDGINFDFDLFEDWLQKHNKIYKLTHRKNQNITIKVTMLKIFKMMRKGHTNRSIASYFGVSDMFITYIRDDIKEKMKRFEKEVLSKQH